MVSKVTHDSKRDPFLIKYVIRGSRWTSIEYELHTPGDMIAILLLLWTPWNGWSKEEGCKGNSQLKAVGMRWGKWKCPYAASD